MDQPEEQASVETDAMSQGTTRYSINAVASAVTVLDLTIGEGSISLEAAARVAGVSRSTAYRLVMTLIQLGLLQKSAAGGYIPGPTAYSWAGKLLSQLDLRSIARPTMQQLRDETRESVNLALLSGSQLVYVDGIESPGNLRTVEEMGSEVPVHAAAVGKTVAAYLDADDVRRMLPDEPFPQTGPNTITDGDRFNRELEVIRETGYALDVEEVHPSVACVAAPIMFGPRVVGAISVSGPRSRLPDHRLRLLGIRVKEAADSISASLPT